MRIKSISGALAAFAVAATGAFAQDSPIVHDAEYYILEAQNGKV